MSSKKIVAYLAVSLLLLVLTTSGYVVFKIGRIVILFKTFDAQRNEYRVALEKGEFARALEVALASERTATKLEDPRKAGKPALTMKALAYELTGDLDAASENYRKGAEVRDLLRDARLAYKKGENAAAFALYCAYPKENAFPKFETLAKRRESTRIRVMCEDLYVEHYYCGKNFDGRVLAPFATYSDFLTFMEEEFKAQGEPARHAEAMEFFRSCAPDASNGDAGNGNAKAEESDVNDVSKPDDEASKTQAKATK